MPEGVVNRNGVILHASFGSSQDGRCLLLAANPFK